MYNFGKTVYTLRKSSRDDIVLSLATYGGRVYVNICVMRERPDNRDEDDGRQGVVGFVSFDVAHFKAFLEGVEVLRDAIAVIEKGGVI